MPIRKNRKLKAVKAELGAPVAAPVATSLAAPITEAITIADIFSVVPNEDALEALLDEESDADFGLPNADATPRAVLKEWTAQDFSNIYTRFRPHLERHARRFLSNPSQVDEVVQDAFLYLMVTLPELDSEIGVLRFMKWKVRLLCLDVIRASGRAYVNSIDDIAEPESLEPEVGSELEHIEDAAIVRLALAKLNPRHREVLLASMYEEKSAAQIAAQVGLSENATRQLIFRARAAFKTALLGTDVDTTGMSVSAILSVAARKAAAEAKKVGAQAMVLVLFMMLAVGAVINFTGTRNTQTTTVAGGASSPTAASESASASAETAAGTETAKITQPAGSESVNNAKASDIADSPSLSITPIVFSSPTAVPSNVSWEAQTPASTPTPSQSPFTASQLKSLYSADPTVAGAIKAAAVSSSANIQAFDVYDSVGSHARIEISTFAANKVTSAVFDFTIKNQKYFVYLNDQRVSETELADGSKAFTITGIAKLPFDATGKVWDLSAFAGSAVELTFVTKADYSQIQKAVFAVTAPKI